MGGSACLRVNFGEGFTGVNISSKVWECHDLKSIQFKINVIQIKCNNMYNYAATIPGHLRALLRARIL